MDKKKSLVFSQVLIVISCVSLVLLAVVGLAHFFIAPNVCGNAVKAERSGGADNGKPAAGDESFDKGGKSGGITVKEPGKSNGDSSVDLKDGQSVETAAENGADNIESESDILGDFLLKAEAGALTEERSDNFCRLWPEMRSVIALDNLNRQNNGKKLEFKDSHERIIYDFLFSGGDELRKCSYDQLKKVVCFDRLMRLGRLFFNGKAPLNSKYLHCPVSKEKYTAADNMLSCPSCGVAFDNNATRMIGAPEELYRQLSMGYYNEKRSHGLDAYILGSGAAAVRSGEIVAEIGCGVGCYTDSLAKGAAPGGKVIAMDVNESVLKFVEYAAGQQNSKVETLLVERDDPRLAPGSVDRIYMIDILNVMTGINVHNNKPINDDSRKYLQKLSTALKDNGVLVVVDFYPFEDCPHIPPEKTIEIMSEFDLKKVEAGKVESGLHNMYILTFEKNEKKQQ